MIDEVKAATEYITKVLRKVNENKGLDAQKFDYFDLILQSLLCERYENHWHPEKPFKGSAYRCIRINHKMEPMLAKAANMSNIPLACIDNFPPEFTIWVDPTDVSYRFGENGSIGVLYPIKESDTESTDSDSSYVSHAIPIVAPPPRTTSYYTPPRTCKEQMQYSNPQDNLNLRKLTAFVSS